MFESKQLKDKVEILHEKIIDFEIELNSYNKILEILNEKVNNLMLNKPNGLSIDENKRIADLEVKMSKLWTMLVEQTPTGKEKLNKFGRNFYKRN